MSKQTLREVLDRTCCHPVFSTQKRNKMYYVASVNDDIPLWNGGNKIAYGNLRDVYTFVISVDNQCYRVCRTAKGTKREKELLELGFQMVPEEALDKYVGAEVKRVDKEN